MGKKMGEGAAQKSGRPEGNLFYEPDIRLKNTPNVQFFQNQFLFVLDNISYSDFNIC
jgi:hypothetical protein